MTVQTALLDAICVGQGGFVLLRFMADAQLVSKTLTLLLAQAELAWHKPETNFAHFTALTAEGALGADVVILPEMFATGFTMHPQQFGDAVGHDAQRYLEGRALDTGAIHAGSSAYFDDHRKQYVNRFLWASPSGKTEYYDKRHRFAMAGEDEAYGPGHVDQVRVSVNGWRVLLQVCYDLRFPGFSRNRIGPNGYDVAIYVANWPRPRRLHWRTLLQARAIENQAYVVGVNRVGEDANGYRYAGDSMCVAPSGEVLLDASDQAGAFEVQLDYDALLDLRSALPFLQDADELRWT